MKVISLFCAFLFLLLSCTSNQVVFDHNKQLLSAPNEPQENSYFKDHFEIDEIIKIQTSEDLLISDIKRLIRFEDKIILLSGENKSIFVINAENGHIDTHINRIGTGPGESNNIIDIAYDEFSERILVYNDYYKLILFDVQGEFLSEIKVDGIYEGISWIDGEVVFHSRLEGYSSFPYLVKVLNLATNTWREIGHDVPVDFAIRSLGRTMVKSKHLWFAAPLDYNLFYFNKGEVHNPYEILMSKIVTEGLIQESKSNPQYFFQEVIGKELIYALNSIRETTDYLVFRPNLGGIFIVDKNEDEIYWDSYVEEDLLDINLTYYYPHDGNDDKIMFVLPAEVYAQHQQSNHHSSKTMLDVKEDDNPILIFYKQKNI